MSRKVLYEWATVSANGEAVTAGNTIKVTADCALSDLADVHTLAICASALPGDAFGRGVKRELLRLSQSVASQLRSHDLAGRTIALKIRFADFSTISRSRTLSHPTDISHDIYATAVGLFEALGLDRARLRLVGVRAEGLVDSAAVARQLTFDEEPEAWRDAERAADQASRRFGRGAVRPASLVEPRALQSYFWARFAQPTVILWARAPAVRERVVRALARAVMTTAWQTRALLDADATLETLWPRAFQEAYRTELRAEAPERGIALYQAFANRYDTISRIVFDPDRISYRNLVEFFLQMHRPDLDEGVLGSGYRSEIFCLTGEQRQIAEDTIADADAAEFWPGGIKTRVSEAGTFWEAGAEDQDYFRGLPDGSQFPRPRVKAAGREAAA